MDKAERDRLFARVVERARARPRPSKAATDATFATAITRVRRVLIGTQSVAPMDWDAIVERATRRSRTDRS